MSASLKRTYTCPAEMKLETGDLVEVLADDPESQYWYGEVTDVNRMTVNYISPFKGEVWRFDENIYHVDKESINFVVDMSNKSKARGWRELGYVYRGDHEILHVDDVDSEEDDDDWVPVAEEEQEDDDDDDADESDDVNSDDDSIEQESEPEDVINSDDEDEDESEEDDSEEDVRQKKKRRTSNAKKTVIAS